MHNSASERDILNISVLACFNEHPTFERNMLLYMFVSKAGNIYVGQRWGRIRCLKMQLIR